MPKLIFEGTLTPIPYRDAYATQPIYGILTGPELFSIRNNPGKLKELILEKLKLSYQEAINRVETAGVVEEDERDELLQEYGEEEEKDGETM